MIIAIHYYDTSEIQAINSKAYNIHKALEEALDKSDKNKDIEKIDILKNGKWVNIHQLLEK